ncbi:MAG: cytochrome ubiquinol oxidase subunit I [Actinomycetes bacterium]|jgi:cytochrome d ubiquinol oxidase subunit I|nr:cytochrome ubiquinol oxidase subunit I [Actinomycetes bacterium]
MGFFTDVVALSRFQFAMTVIFHFLFVPLSIGLGLIVALAETRYYKTRDAHDLAAANLWVKIFTATFVVGVATGITMEFAFGTNWADYSRFVGDIFGAPLAAEALFAFFLESSFLGVLLFGRKKVSPKFYMVSSWLVWGGSALSALWIIIANSWMQTPAGAVVKDGRAVITDFFAAAINHSTGPRYVHTVVALLILGAFIAMAIAAWYLIKGRNERFAVNTIKTAAVVALVTTILMIPAAHWQAAEMANTQPSKTAAVEGQWEDGPTHLAFFGWVDEDSGKTFAPFAIPGMTSFLASGDFNKTYPGLNSFDAADRPTGLVNTVFQTYHLMVALFVVIAVVAVWAFVAARKNRLTQSKGLQRVLLFAWIAPFLAIQFGWMVAELGRQPWIVYPMADNPDVSLRTADAISKAVPAPQLLITIALFLVVYIVLFIGWLRVVLGFIKKGPIVDGATDNAGSTSPTELPSANVADVADVPAPDVATAEVM